MANRLSATRREALWAAWLETQSAEFVVRKCGVHHRTVERYRVLDRWDERLAGIRQQAQKRADYTLADAMAESLALVRSYKNRLARALESKTVSADEVTAAELERIIKLESFVLGGSEGRQEIRTQFANWSDEDLERYASNGVVPGESGSRSP